MERNARTMGGRAQVLAWALLVGACGGDATADAAQGDARAPDGTTTAREQREDAPARAPANVLRLERAAIVDRVGFEEPMVAATVFLPHGWTTEGGVAWADRFLCTNGWAFDWRARSPDGRSSIALLPAERWESNNTGAPASLPGCPLAPFADVRAYLENLLSRAWPQARVETWRPREDVRAELAPTYDRVVPTAVGEMRTWVEAGELVLAWREEGVAMRGSLGATVVFTRTVADTGMGAMIALSAHSFASFAAAAPKERYDRAFFEALRRSLQLDPRWEQRIGEHDAGIARAALREVDRRRRASKAAFEEISALNREAWDSYHESSDRRFNEFNDALRGVETYDDPDGPTGRTQLSNRWEHAWRLADGSYVLTDDADFEPYGVFGQEGTRLEPAR